MTSKANTGLASRKSSQAVTAMDVYKLGFSTAVCTIILVAVISCVGAFQNREPSNLAKLEQCLRKELSGEYAPRTCFLGSKEVLS